MVKITGERDKYFIFNHEKAFSEGIYDRLICAKDALGLKTGAGSGSFISPLLDSGRQGNIWQRILIDIECPQGTFFGCVLYAFDSTAEAARIGEILKKGLAGLPLPENELLPHRVFETTGVRDFLPREAVGRYLIARLEMNGGRDKSPLLKSLCIYAYQESFINYLPQIFRQENSFLHSFLSLFSVPYLETEKRIENIPACFDPLAAPAELLPWLAEISGIPNVALWNTESLRKLLSMGTYRRKGTLSGLYELIDIFTGSRPYIAESFRMKCGIEEIERLYGECNIYIFIPAACEIEKSMEESLRIVIESYLPTELRFRLVNLSGRARLGAYSYLDVNAVLNEYEKAIIDMNSCIGDVAIM